MQIEMGINPNCSEAIVRFKTNKLTKKQEEALYAALKIFVDEYNYETDIFRNTIFGIKCIIVDGDAPYNDYAGLMASIKNVPFINRVKIEREEK